MGKLIRAERADTSEIVTGEYLSKNNETDKQLVLCSEFNGDGFEFKIVEVRKDTIKEI